MRVLHLPYNIASIPRHTIKSLRLIGIDARGLMAGGTVIQSFEDITVVDISGKTRIARLCRKLYFLGRIIRQVAWADVIHWYYSELLPWGLDLKLIKLFNKPSVVEWLGSEIRIPEREFEDNPFYELAFRDSSYEYPCESHGASVTRQARFIKNGFIPIVSGMTGTKQYLQQDLVGNRYFCVAQRLTVAEFIPKYPDPNKRKPLIVHSPSAPVTKGTRHVVAAIAILKEKYDFDFLLIQNMPHGDALQVLSEADIYLDQFILGLYGMAALEAMAFGKPVVCYMKPSLQGEFPSDIPVINANPLTLAEKLEPLIIDGALRREAGMLSRRYVEKYHDAATIADQLVGIYTTLLNAHK